MTLTVTAVGPQALVEDVLGRRGFGSSGVSTSGAYDRASLLRAHRILGNEPSLAGIEVLMGGLSLRADDDHLVCVTGAAGALHVDGKPIHHEWPTLVSAGQTLRLGLAEIGMRTYVSVQGGIQAPAVLGSPATDTLSGLGASPLSVGDVLAVGNEFDGAVAGQPEVRLGNGDVTIEVIVGPRDDWFTAEALAMFWTTRWSVSSESDRVGMRLEGPALARSRSGELPSEPCMRGSIQVTAQGQPIIFGPDHPVTGGYPVIAVVTDNHADLLGQVRPGQGLRFARRG
ncbi:biotin-dependent carboxyltransferase family protein [soil metagenome]